MSSTIHAQHPSDSTAAPESGQASVTPTAPSIFTLMSRLPPPPASLATVRISKLLSVPGAGPPADLVGDLLKTLDQLGDAGCGAHERASPGPSGGASSDSKGDIFQSLNSLTTISSNNAYFSPTSRYDDVKM
eukprot:GHVO01018821.1.p1 GENE.GHVO01018821.1~~GHVO01018821.1.p1  ORF type:complete len:132 (+),score=5.81 GHVO01018821.1:115-510(+)